MRCIVLANGFPVKLSEGISMKFLSILALLTTIPLSNAFASTARISCDWSESQQRYIGPQSTYDAAVALDRHCQSRGYAGAAVDEVGECHRDLLSLGIYVVADVRYGCANEIWR